MIVVGLLKRAWELLPLPNTLNSASVQRPWRLSTLSCPCATMSEPSREVQTAEETDEAHDKMTSSMPPVAKPSKTRDCRFAIDTVWTIMESNCV